MNTTEIFTICQIGNLLATEYPHIHICKSATYLKFVIYVTANNHLRQSKDSSDCSLNGDR